MGLLQQADSAEYRAAARLLNVFLSTKNELLQGGEGEEADDDEEGDDVENPSASMEEEVKIFPICGWLVVLFLCTSRLISSLSPLYVCSTETTKLS